MWRACINPAPGTRGLGGSGRCNHREQPRTAFRFSREPLQTFHHHPTAAVARYAPMTVSAPDWDVFSFWSARPWRLAPKLRLAGNWPPQHMEFLACLMCLKHWATEPEIRTWRRKYWIRKEKKWCNLSDEQRRELPRGRNRRKDWRANWRTGRKMRDLDADLKAYEWGSHNELRDVPQMLVTARQNYREARKEWAKHRGINVRQQPAPHKTTRSLDSLVNHVPAPALVYEPRQTYFLRKPVTFPRLPFQLTFNFWQESTASSTA
jgi:hypothetical protein